MRRFLSILVLTLCAFPVSPAQAQPDPGPVLTLTSVPEGLRVYADSLFLGTTPLYRIPVTPGPVRLNIFSADTTYWFSSCVVDSFFAGDSGTVTRHIGFPKWVRVVSEPSGAEVLLGDSLLGTTPLLGFVPSETAYLTVRAEGHEPTRIFLTRELHSSVRADLRYEGAGGAPAPVYLSRDVGESYSAVYIATASAVVAGAAAAILKSRADRYYDEYRATGSDRDLDRVRHYDLLSGFALAATEISLGYLLYDLLSR